MQAPVKAPPIAPSAPSEEGVPSPAQTAADGAVFPVAGAHNFGGPENRFGAAREATCTRARTCSLRKARPWWRRLLGRSSRRAIRRPAPAITPSSTPPSGSTSCSPTARPGRSRWKRARPWRRGRPCATLDRPVTPPRRICTSRSGWAAGRRRRTPDRSASVPGSLGTRRRRGLTRRRAEGRALA